MSAGISMISCIQSNSLSRARKGTSSGDSSPPASFVPQETAKAQVNQGTSPDAQIASLKILALTLLQQIDSLEHQSADREFEFNLQREVHEFEAALIRGALIKTGGRQRRAARLLGVKVTTLNTKIKRHKITLDDCG